MIDQRRAAAKPGRDLAMTCPLCRILAFVRAFRASRPGEGKQIESSRQSRPVYREPRQRRDAREPWIPTREWRARRNTGQPF